MGSTRQNRKRRSSRPKIKQSNKPKKPLNPRGNSIVAQNWNKKETLAQNYRRLGLTARLKAPTGGIEKTLRQTKTSSSSRSRTLDPFAIEPAHKAVITEARIERDAEGNVIGVRYVDSEGKKQKRKRDNPLNDPLLELESASESDDEGGEEWGGIEAETDEDGKTDVVRMLEEEASRPEQRRPRHQSQQEREWVGRLVAKHGEDTAAMARDRKLNVMQQTEGDIARRVKRWKEDQGSS